MPDAVPMLTGERGRLVGQRVPTGVLRLAVVVGVLVPVAFSIAAPSDAPVTAALVESPEWLVASVVQSLAVAAVALVFFAPTAGVLVAAVATAVVSLLPAGHGGAPGAWAAAGATLGLLGVVDLLIAARRRALTSVAQRDTGGSAMAPVLPRYLTDSLYRVGAWRVTVGSLLLVAAAGLVGWGFRDADVAAEFRAHAETVDATVLSVSDDGTSAQVSVGAQVYRLPVTNATRHDDERVRVRLDEGTGRCEALDDAFDPTFILVPVAAAAVVGIAMIARTRRLRRRIRALLTQPQPVVGALATLAPRARGALLVPYDDAGRSVAVAPNLLQIVTPEKLQPGWWEDGEGEWAHGEFETSAYGERADAQPVSVADLSDEELLALAGVTGEPEPPDHGEPVDGPAGWRLTPVTVIGPLDDGWPVVLVHDDSAFLSSGPLRFPAWRAARPRVGPAQEGVSAWRAINDATGAALITLGVVAGRWVPWLALPGAWLLSTWIVSVTGPSLRLIVPGLVLVTSAWAVSMIGQSAVDIRPEVLHFRGVVVDLLVPWGCVTGVSTGDSAVIVRYDDGSDGGAALVLAEKQNARRLTRDGASAAQVAARIEMARALGDGTARQVRRRPTASTVLAVCWLLAVFLPAFVA